VLALGIQAVLGVSSAYQHVQSVFYDTMSVLAKVLHR
jgi:hypothetical protein